MKKIFLLSFFLVTLPFCCHAAAPSEEQSALRTWATAALLNASVNPPAALPPGLYLGHQDYDTLKMRQSVMNTPLQIGTQHFAQGLGTHATSEVIVRLPQPALEFTAQVGKYMNLIRLNYLRKQKTRFHSQSLALFLCR